MAKLSRKKGTTSQIFHVVIKDSTSTTGAGKTGLAYNTASLVCRYINAGGTLSASITLEDITTLGTYAAPTSNAHMRFKEVSNADPSKGLYEIHVHNDWMNLTGGSLIIMLAGATGMADCQLEVDLQADVNVTHISGTAQTARDIGASVLLSSGTGAGQISLTSGLVTLAGVTHTGAVIPTVTTLTGHTPQTGDAYARLGAPAGASISVDIAGVQSDTDDIQSRIPAALDGSGYIQANAVTVTDKAGYALSSAGVQAIWDFVVEGTLKAKSLLRVLLSFAAGKASGGGTTTKRFRDNADLKDRIVATTDTNNNRTSITIDGE
ncbi:MAG: hypothetical protein A2X93_09110 [Deltaproteobacteria bacterium GWC2_56_8]|nr:MAG: hypothetical protein A2X99_10245 [Deltaproteobacteria bacterium GWB2_55_19]OGP35430.1 MAG: hypothetical protein A2X93_09110 [Deltaproteobacteria bacterium GWC2_56_8]HAO93413.1 hypothetical protein [Deltaproteobacteria bacterium]